MGSFGGHPSFGMPLGDHRHIPLKVPNEEFDFDVWSSTFGFAPVDKCQKPWISLVISSEKRHKLFLVNDLT